jgi:uncharacterized membrane protein
MPCDAAAPGQFLLALSLQSAHYFAHGLYIGAQLYDILPKILRGKLLVLVNTDYPTKNCS